MDDTAAYLKRFPPFDHMSDEELARAASDSETRTFATGTTILVEDGPPARHLYVLLAGSVELGHDDEVIDVLEAGEVFGHPSLLSGLAPAFDVRAREDATCLLIPDELARSILGKPSGAAFVASTLRERMVRTGHVAHAQADVRTAHLGSLMHRPAVLCEPGESAREAAARMAESDVSCILVRTPSGFGILTDSDLRRKLVARGLSLETPVSELMVHPALTFARERLAIDAMIDMLDAGIHHLPIVDAAGTPVGVVTATDLMYLEGRTPFAIRRSIAHAESADAVVAEARHLPATAVQLVRAGVSAADVSRVLALSSDTATTRLLELAMAEHGTAPRAWAWLALGSVARRELSLASDQDNALAYADGPDGEDADAYFARVAADVNSGLARCGFGTDNAGVLAQNRQWRMSSSEWQGVFRTCLEQPDRSHLVRAAVAFDFRQVLGGLDIVPPLVAVEREAPRHPDFIRRLARTATDFRPPLGFRGRISVEKGGEYAGTIDLKRAGIIPIANLARFHALSAGITISGTAARLEAARTAGALDDERAAALLEAFELVSRLRLEHQAGRVEQGREPDNRLDPRDLAPLTRSQLREAFHIVADAQGALGRFVPLGM